MLTVDWAEELIDEAVQLDGSFRDIELPCMVRQRPGRGTPYEDQLRSDVLAAVEAGRLVAEDVELRCLPAGHLVWSGSPGELESAKRDACRACGVPLPPEQLRVTARFSIPQSVVDEVVARRRARP